jgi:pyridoxine 4-dehydrogenase
VRMRALTRSLSNVFFSPPLLSSINTTDSYGTGKYEGRSETLLGEFSTRDPSSRKKMAQFCTKLAPFPWRLTKQSLLETFEGSKQRMQRSADKPVDMIQLHWPPALPFQESNFLDAFKEIIDRKEATQIGEKYIVAALSPRTHSSHRRRKTVSQVDTCLSSLLTSLSVQSLIITYLYLYFSYHLTLRNVEFWAEESTISGPGDKEQN